jgi:tRNA dimethylallyltransferase
LRATGELQGDELCIAGPTACGKSAVAMALAELLEGEIVAVDSMQVYRGLDVGTAKPSAPERKRIRHHLIDMIDLREEFDVAQFLEAARSAMADIRKRGRRVLLCGGTGLYFKALAQGLGEGPARDAGLRERLEATPMPALLAELERVDEESFRRVDRRNRRRVVRAIEVCRLTGRPFSEQRAPWSAEPGRIQIVALDRDAEDLRRRIDARVNDMFARGLVGETRRLLGQGLANNRTALQAIGYRQVVEYLRGERDHAETIALVKQRTWQFARRQRSWLRTQMPPTWVLVPPGEPPAATARRVLDATSQSWEI